MRRAGRPVCAASAALFALWIGAALPFPAAAHSFKFGTIAVGHLWAPPTAPGAEGAAVYGPLLNHGPGADSLIGASTPVAASVRFRVAKDGKTSWPASIELAPARPLGLAPWRVHLWLTGLKRPLKAGDHFDMTLTFAHAGTHTVEVMVEKTPGH